MPQDEVADAMRLKRRRDSYRVRLAQSLKRLLCVCRCIVSSSPTNGSKNYEIKARHGRGTLGLKSAVLDPH